MAERCLGQNQWVGGISPQAHIDSNEAMHIMCCTYEKLKNSQDRGIISLRSGQAVKGGEIRNEEGRQGGFEYVSSIERMFDQYGVVYTIHMRSFNCVPEPNGETGVEAGANQYLIDQINAIDHPPTKAPPSRSESSTAFPTLPNLLGLPTLAPFPGFPGAPQQQAQGQARIADNEGTFNERTFELPEEMPAEEAAPQQPKHHAQPASNGKLSPIPIAQPYEEAEEGTEPLATLPVAQEFARAHAAPSVPLDPVPLPSQVSYNANVRPQPQYLRPSHSPTPPTIQLQLPQLDPFGLLTPPAQPAAQANRARAHGIRTYGPGAEQDKPQRRYGPQVVQQQYEQQQLQQLFNPFQNLIVTPPPTPTVRALPQIAPINIPSVEDVENAIPAESRNLITSIANRVLAAFH